MTNAQQQSVLDDSIFRTLVEICGEGLIVVNSEWHVKYMNAAYTRIFGYTIETLPDGDTFAIVHPEDKEKLQSRTLEMLQDIHTGEPVEFRAYHANGSLRYIEGWGKFLPSGDIVGFLHDITARKITEMELRASEERFRALFELSEDGVAIFSPTGEFTYISPSFTRIFGYHLEDLRNVSTFSLLHPDDLERATMPMYDLLEGRKERIKTEYRMRHKDDNYRYCEGVGRLLSDGSIVAFISDVTERIENQKALENSEAKYRTLIETSAAGIATYSQTGELSYISPSFTALFGYDETDIKDMKALDFVHPDYLAEGVNQLSQLFSGQIAQAKMQYPLKCKDGSYRHIDGYARLLPDGTVVAYLADIHERVSAQKALQESETKFRTLIETSPDAVVTFSEDGKFTYISPRFTELFGYDAADVAKMVATDVTYEEDLSSAHQTLSALYAGETEEARLKYRFKHKDGRLRYVEGYGRLLPDRTVVGFINDMTQQHLEDAALRAIVEGTANVTGDEFFRSFVKHLAIALDVRHVYVTRPDEKRKNYAQTLANWSDGDYRSDCNYSLLDTPCQETWENGFCYYADQIQAHFPNDALLKEIGAESYMGIALRSSSGQTIGHIAVMDNQAMRDEAVRKRILQIFAARASTEMERLQAEDALLLLNAELEQRIEERTAELAATLREQRQLAAIIEATTDYVGIADLQGFSLYVNQHGRQMVGKTDEDFKTRWNVVACHPEAEHPKLFAMVADAIAGRASTGETILLHKSGKEIPVSMVSVPLKNAEGQVEAMAAIMRDISAQKQAAAELQAAKEAAEAALASQQRLIKIIEATSDLVAMVAPDGKGIYLNRAGRELVGIGINEDVSQLNMMAHYPPHVLQEIMEVYIPQSIANGGVWQGENIILNRAGKEIPISQAGLVIFDEKGEMEYLATIARDISERKLVETELKQAKDAAEAASRAKSTFLANMSHEIRTPMNAIIGMTSLLLDTPLQARQADFVETIRHSGDALLTIINDILDFSKIEAEKLELVYRPLNIRECVESALDLLAPMAAEKHIDLAYVMDENVPLAIVGDGTRLRQILVNLLSNAVKFTAQGEVVVTVSSMPRKGELHELHFAVRDTGMGIPEDKMNRLFKAFSQVDTSMTREFGGTGLGLAISKRLSELMGGTTWAESEGIAGRGSTFHFTILAEAAKETVKTFLLGKQPQLKNKRVLIVDDNATNRRILSLQCQTWGMPSDAAALPSEALELIKTMAFDVAILDMHMPEMDGVSLAEKIHSLAEGRHLPLIMLSSAMQNGDLSEFAATLSKPVKPSELYNSLMSLFTSAEQSLATQESKVIKEEDTLLAESLPLHILLAEDVLVNQKFAVHALERMGYRVDVVANGQEAFDAVMRQSYDLVLMDVQMPVMDGLEATRRIRQSSISQPQIIAMTANAMQGDREICLEAGMDDYISKPVYLQELRAALERAGNRMSKTRTEQVQSQSVAIAEILELGRDLLEAFIDEIPLNLLELKEADTAKAIGEAAHKIKGSCAYIGANEAKELASRIERMANAGDANGPKLLYGQLSIELEKTIQLLRQALEA